MTPLVVEGMYENGVIRPDQPLPLKDHQRVRFTIHDSAAIASALDAVRRTYGLIPWTGDPETLRRIAEDPEFGILESP